MKAMLRFRNGDRREIELDDTQTRDGYPLVSIFWRDGDVDAEGNCDVGGKRVGIREFWLDIKAYVSGTVRYEEMHYAPIGEPGKKESNHEFR